MMQEALLLGIGEWIKKTGDAIYEGKPCGVLGQGKNFALKKGNKLYFYVHDLGIVGDSNVTVEFGGAGEKTFTGVNGKIKSVRWTDCDETLSFTQDGETVKIDCTGYHYGTNLVVRVAEAEMEE
jgi:alpha-L-fucosidase